MLSLDECYEILELQPGAQAAELKAAYRDLAFVWHPDRFSHSARLQEKAEEKFLQIKEAYELLSTHLSRPSGVSAALPAPTSPPKAVDLPSPPVVSDHPPGDAWDHVRSGDAHLEKRDYSRAEEAYKRSLRLKAGNVHPHFGLGNVYFQRGLSEERQGSFSAARDLFAEAIASFQQALDLQPTFAAAHKGMGDVYLHQKQYAQAEQSYKKALIHRPDDLPSCIGLGLSCSGLGCPERAELAYKKAISLGHDDPLPYESLGTLYYNQGRYEEAEGIYKHLLALIPAQSKPYDLLGQVYSRQKRYDEAIQIFQEALRIAPNDWKVRQQMQWALSARAEPAPAKSRWPFKGKFAAGRNP